MKLYIIDQLTAVKSYAYIDSISTIDNQIIISIEGGYGDNKYHHHEFINLGQGIYRLQLYISFFQGQYFPKTIYTDNDNHQLKEIRQENINGEDEIIYLNQTKGKGMINLFFFKNKCFQE